MEAMKRSNIHFKIITRFEVFCLKDFVDFTFIYGGLDLLREKRGLEVERDVG